MGLFLGGQFGLCDVEQVSPTAFAQSSVVEPISSSPVPILIGLSNMQRWKLLVHPMDGLISASA